MSFFPHEKNTAMVQNDSNLCFYRGGSCRKKYSNDSRLTVITISSCPSCSRASGPFLCAIQGQRGGSIINMKGTERDRSKPSGLVSIKGFKSPKRTDDTKSDKN